MLAGNMVLRKAYYKECLTLSERVGNPGRMSETLNALGVFRKTGKGLKIFIGNCSNSYDGKIQFGLVLDSFKKR